MEVNSAPRSKKWCDRSVHPRTPIEGAGLAIWQTCDWGSFGGKQKETGYSEFGWGRAAGVGLYFQILVFFKICLVIYLFSPFPKKMPTPALRPQTAHSCVAFYFIIRTCANQTSKHALCRVQLQSEVQTGLYTMQCSQLKSHQWFLSWNLVFILQMTQWVDNDGGS